MTAGLAGLGLVIHLVIDVLKDALLGGPGAGDAELGCRSGLGLGLSVDLLDLRLGDHLLAEKLVLPEGERVVLGLVELDFLGCTVLLGIRVGDGMPVVAVRRHLENGRFGLVAGTLHGGSKAGSQLVKVEPLAAGPIDIEALGAGGKGVSERGGALETGAHRVAVVLNHIDDREIPESGDVEALAVDSLIDCAVAQKGDRTALDSLVLEGKGKAESERGLAGDDAVTTPVMLVGSEEVHRPTLALGAAGALAEELGHAFVHAHADGQGVAVVTIGGDDLVAAVHQGGGADGNRLLADVKVEESPHDPLIVIFQRLLLKAADAEHFAEEAYLLCRLEGNIERGLGEVGAS